MLTPIRYIGSKNRLSSLILSIIPPHDGYIEVFGGSGALLIQKSPEVSKFEVYNDFDGYLVAFFRVLREHPYELQRLCQLTPYSREEQRYCFQTFQDPSLNDLERARRVYTMYRQGFAGKYSSGWAFNQYSDCAQSFRNHSDALLTIADRLRNVAFENDSFEKIIPRYSGNKRNLLYCDPPYLADVRGMKVNTNCKCTPDKMCKRCSIYRCEMSLTDHIRFLKAITTTPAMAIVSGYDSDVYEDYLISWKRYAKVQSIGCSNILGDGKTRKATEILWVNNAAEIALREAEYGL
jgi:DNA adenine methylase